MMVATCLQVVGFVTSFVGWIGIIVTTSTNDWVVTCGYTIPTCRKLDELGSKGLWADCVMATGLYHCKPLVDLLILPGKDPCLGREGGHRTKHFEGSKTCCALVLTS